MALTLLHLFGPVHGGPGNAAAEDRVTEQLAAQLERLKKVKFHQVAEWPADKGRDFKEAPQLTKMVKEGKLPPVAERLPENPLVIVPPDQNGPYGGTWVRFGISPGDVSQYRHRIAYEALLRWDPLGRKLLPNLASKWEVGDGGRSFTFWLRKGVRWSDGRPFTADDILFWYNSVLLNKELTPGISPTFKKGGQTVRVEKVDQFTVRFLFAEPHGLFLQHMAGEAGYDLVSYPAHYLKQFHVDFVDKAKLEEMARAGGRDFWYQFFKTKGTWRNPEMPTLWAWSLIKPPPARPALFERNPYYWKVDPEGNQLPYLDKVTFGIYDPETINLKAINGEVGMQGRHLSFQNIQLFLSNKDKGGYKVLRWLDGGVGNLVLCPNQNHKDKSLAAIFGDKRFRIALSHAINREEMNQTLYLDLCRPRQMAPPYFSKFYDQVAEQAYLKYDPALANKLLDEMGLDKKDSKGFRLKPDGQPLFFQLEVSNNIEGLQALQMVTEYWREVGLKCDLKVMARQLYKQRMKSLQHDIGAWKGAGAINPVVDPRYFIPYSKSSIQAIGYAKWFRSDGKKGPEPPAEIKETIDLYRRIQSTPDDEKQLKLMKKILDLNRENLWVIGTVGDVPQLFLVQNSFRNVPELAVASWVVHAPGNTAPECYAKVK